jgi:hypothetical protein
MLLGIHPKKHCIILIPAVVFYGIFVALTFAEVMAKAGRKHLSRKSTGDN